MWYQWFSCERPFKSFRFKRTFTAESLVLIHNCFNYPLYITVICRVFGSCRILMSKCANCCCLITDTLRLLTAHIVTQYHYQKRWLYDSIVMSTTINIKQKNFRFMSSWLLLSFLFSHWCRTRHHHLDTWTRFARATIEFDVIWKC